MEVKVQNKQSMEELQAGLDEVMRKNAEIAAALNIKDIQQQNKEAIQQAVDAATDAKVQELEAKLAERDKAIKELSDTNQRLFLRLGAPLTDEPVPQMPKEVKDPTVEEALRKIEEYNKTIS